MPPRPAFPQTGPRTPTRASSRSSAASAGAIDIPASSTHARAPPRAMTARPSLLHTSSPTLPRASHRGSASAGASSSRARAPPRAMTARPSLLHTSSPTLPRASHRGSGASAASSSRAPAPPRATPAWPSFLHTVSPTLPRPRASCPSSASAGAIDIPARGAPRAMPATVPFPTTLEGMPMRFCCRSQFYDGRVARAERDEDGSFATVLLQLPCRPPRRPFAVGELAWLETPEESWTATVAMPKPWRDEVDAAPLHVHVFPSVPDPGHCSGFAYDALLNIYPANPNLIHLSFNPSNGYEDVKLRVALIGFGALGRHLVQALLDSEYIDLIAISIDSPTNDMPKAWNDSLISLRIRDPSTILFKRQNMEVHEEVMVRVVHDRDSWDELAVDYVVDSTNIVTGEKIVIHSMPYKGKGKANAYSLVYDDKGIGGQLPEVTAEMQVKFKYMKLVVTSVDALEALVSNLAEWDRNSARICFLADDNPTERLCNPFAEQSYNNNPEARIRVSTLLRIFIDVIRRVRIAGCHLKL